jgi:hypothetical protein
VVYEAAGLRDIGVLITDHDKLPDVLLYRFDKNWLYLIEALTSHGPISSKRHQELENMLSGCRADRF